LNVSFFNKSGELKIIKDISYNIPQGKILGIVGESGCGKSVVSLAIMGLLPHQGKIVGGEIFFKNLELSQYNENRLSELRGNRLAMIFQEPMTSLNPVLTIGSQISEQIIRHLGYSKKMAVERTVDLLDKVGIAQPRRRKNEYPHQLSGGMKQRVMIAMAISCDPDFLIADEPTTALDVTIQAQILDLLYNLQDSTGMTIQFITHDFGVIREIADYLLVMYAGRIIESAPAEQILENPRHPYTKGLINSIPSMGEKRKMLFTIPGEVPSPSNLPRGCSFVNRCQYSTLECSQGVPRLEVVEKNHEVACFAPINN
jgi:peptide/nickel transport system ATP-binding protein